MIFYLFWLVIFATATYCAYKISAADFRRRIIPDAYLFPLFLIGLVTAAFFPHWIIDTTTSIIGATTGYVLGAGIGIIFEHFSRKKNAKAPAPIGMGDIKLLATGGAWIGVTGLSIALIVACIVGGIWAKYKKQRFIPFAPFFVLGAILALIVMAFLI
ncbi:MAG: prepilin peptidase [Alphaproteobacteria bacterium]|nr:prepilin peptidase [Alphaproteobacteria bacterium]